MNKAAGIGIIVIIIVLIVGITFSLSSTESNDENLPTVEELSLDESVSFEEEIVPEELEETGTDYSVELTERIGFKTP